MGVGELIGGARAVLTEGAVIERLRREAGLSLDPAVLHAGFLYDATGRAALARLYRQYLEVGRAADLPMLVGTPTWRANPERLAAAGLAGRDVSGDAVHFLRGLRDALGGYAGQVGIGGLIGPRGDAYRPEEGLSAEHAEVFHRPQAEALAAAGADFLWAATLPALPEALGLARAMAATGSSYVVSFVLRPGGTLLDGAPLGDAIGAIDAGTPRPPRCYLANCVHPSVFGQALEAGLRLAPGIAGRLVGLQANTSARSPEALDGLAELDSETPEALAEGMLALQRRFGLRILGGCCGTDHRHIAAIAAGLTQKTPNA
jgi:homocysteine S-methyltransferase